LRKLERLVRRVIFEAGRRMDLTAIREAETFKWTASEQPGWGAKLLMRQ
jgi:hypothetical protein